MALCPTCGTEITPDMAFCPNCGTSAAVAQPVTVPPVMPASDAATGSYNAAGAPAPNTVPHAPAAQPAYTATAAPVPGAANPQPGYAAHPHYATAAQAPGTQTIGAAPSPAAAQPTANQPIDFNQAIYTKDHTAEFSADDISKNKAAAVLTYVFCFFGTLIILPVGVIGILVTAVIAKDSPYAMFHVREATKIVVADLLALCALILLFWTVIAPIAIGIFWIVLWVVSIICIVNTCRGKAKKAPIVSSLGFLK